MVQNVFSLRLMLTTPGKRTRYEVSWIKHWAPHNHGHLTRKRPFLFYRKNVTVLYVFICEITRSLLYGLKSKSQNSKKKQSTKNIIRYQTGESFHKTVDEEVMLLKDLIILIRICSSDVTTCFFKFFNARSTLDLMTINCMF